MSDSNSKEFEPTQKLSQEDTIQDILASTPLGVWGMLFSDGLTRRIDLHASKAVIGRHQSNITKDDVQYVGLGGAKTS